MGLGTTLSCTDMIMNPFGGTNGKITFAENPVLRPGIELPLGTDVCLIRKNSIVEMTSKHWNQDQPFILVSAQHYRKLNKTSDSSHSLHHCAAGAILKKHKEGMSSYLRLS